MSESPTQPDLVFISYSHTDAAYLQRLQDHLAPYVRSGAIPLWDDTRLRPGDDWRQHMEQALSSARVALLLVSVGFLASEDVAQVELPKLLAAAATRNTRILPIILTPCNFPRTPLSRYQAVNDPRRPLSGLSQHEQDLVWESVVARVLEVLRQPPGLLATNGAALTGHAVPLIQPPPPPLPSTRPLPVRVLVALVMILVVVLGSVLALGLTGNGPFGHPGAKQPGASPTSRPSPTLPPNFDIYANLGDGFRIDYPIDWTKQSTNVNGGKGVEFDGPGGQTVLVLNSGPGQPGSTTESDNLFCFTYGVTIGSTTTVTIAGQSWTREECDQAGGNGHTSYETVLYKGTVYILSYTAPKSTFSTDRSQYFTPMEQSFQFLV